MLSSGIAAALLATSPVAAAGSLYGDDAPFAGGGVLSVPVIYGRKWTATASLNSLYDTNFRSSRDPVAAFRISPIISAGAGLPFGRQQLFVGGDLGRDFYLGKSQFNRNRVLIGGGLAWRVGARCSGSIGAEHLSRLNQVSEQAVFTPNVQNTNVVAGSATCQSSTGLGIGGSIRHQDITNERPERMAFDLRSTVFAPNISYGNPTIGQFSLSGTFNNTTYPQRFAPTPTGIVEEGVKIFSGRAGYSRNFGSRLQVSAGASYLKSSPRPAVTLALDATGQIIQVTRPNFSGGGYDVSVSYRPSSRMTVDIAANRDIRASPNVGAQLIVSQSISGNIGYRLGPKLDFSLGGSHRKNDYKGSFTSPDEARRRISDKFSRVYAQLDYTPVSLYAVSVIVAHQWRDSNPADFNYKGTTASLRLRVNFGRV